MKTNGAPYLSVLGRCGSLLAVVVPLVAVAGFLLISARPAWPFLPTLEAPVNTVHWSLTSFPIQWNLNPDTSTAHISGSRSVTTVIQASFASWTSTPNAAINSGNVTQGPNSTVSSESSSPPNINLVCFVCTGGDFTKDSQTIAVTMFQFVNAAGQPDGHGGTTQFAGQVIKADILFNPNDTFTTDAAAATTSVIDLQTIATHEIGHFFGLDHSAVVAAVMYPFAATVKETLASDDVAGLSVLYPGSQIVATGTIQGQVRFQSSGAGVFGAHVFADSVTNSTGYGGSIRKSPIGALTDPTGAYNLTGLPADSYTITAEPLDGPVTNSDVSDYSPVFGQTTVQTSFTTRQH